MCLIPNKYIMYEVYGLWLCALAQMIGAYFTHDVYHQAYVSVCI